MHISFDDYSPTLPSKCSGMGWLGHGVRDDQALSPSGLWGRLCHPVSSSGHRFQPFKYAGYLKGFLSCSPPPHPNPVGRHSVGMCAGSALVLGAGGRNKAAGPGLNHSPYGTGGSLRSPMFYVLIQFSLQELRAQILSKQI